MSHLVEHRAEREDVRARVGLLAFELLGRHVLQRAEDRALRGERLRAVSSAAIDRPIRQRGGAARFASPKSSSFAPAFVSMTLPGFRSRCDDARAMRLVERVGDLDRVVQDAWSSGSAPFGEPVGQRLALEYSMTRKSMLVLPADVVERADVRMIERGDRPRLALEPLARAAASPAMCAGRTLMATVRSRRVSRAL